MKAGINSRLAKIEAAAGEPRSPLDDMTAVELRAWVLDQAARF
jgi:hypothetical protein